MTNMLAFYGLAFKGDLLPAERERLATLEAEIKQIKAQVAQRSIEDGQ